MNLLEETKEVIQWAKQTAESIVFIGSEDGSHSCTWAEFQVLADFEYDEYSGNMRIVTDLVVVFADGKRLWRTDDGDSETWDFEAPGIEEYTHTGAPITCLAADNKYTSTVAEVNPSATVKAAK